MPRARSLSQASKVNRQKAGKPTRPQRGGVDLPNLPDFIGPPPGTFDPGLEAQVRAAERGLIDLIEKERTSGHREGVDFRQAKTLLMRKISQGRADLQRRRGYATEDAGIDRSRLQTSFERDLEDLAIARQQGDEDFNRKLTEVQHSYATRAARQNEAAVAQGTFDAGTQAASGAVRGANQAFDKGLVETAHNRQLAALALSEGRVREDFGTRSGLIDEGLSRELSALGIQGHRLGLDARTQRGQLRRDLFRGRHDRADTISKAKREYGIYATDVAQQAFYQAHQLNPNIVFPIPSAAAGLAGGGHGPAIGGGVRARRPGAVANKAIGGAGVGGRRAYPRRPRY